MGEHDFAFLTLREYAGSKVSSIFVDYPMRIEKLEKHNEQQVICYTRYKKCGYLFLSSIV
jgi:hypothetical protein